MASVAKRPGGRWRARYRDDAGKEHARHFDRKVDAQRWLNEVTASVMTGTYVDPRAGRVTLAAYFREWSQRQLWAPRTVEAMDLAVRSTTFVDVDLVRLRRSHVESWVKSMTEAGLAPGTVHTRVRNVRSVLRGAVRDRLLISDPSDGVVLPRQRRAQHAMAIPTGEQVGAIIEAADPAFAGFISVCAFAGLRHGEAAGLQVRDVDFLRGILHVRRQVQRLGDGYEVRAPKHGSERAVAVGETLLVELARHIAAHHLGDGDRERWLFGVGDGPRSYNSVRHYWLKARRGARVTDVRLHHLRHYFASGLIAAGCDVAAVARALGHASTSTTHSTYIHLWPDADDRTRAAADALARSAFGARADRGRTADQ